MNELISNKKKSELLAEKIASMNYEDVITHKEISVLISEPYPSGKYTAAVTKARKILLENHCRCIECVVGDGYRVVHPDNFVNQSLKHFKRGFKEIKKAENTLTHAPIKHMSEEGRIVFQRVHDRAVILNAAMQGASVEIKTLSKKTHPLALAVK